MRKTFFQLAIGLLFVVAAASPAAAQEPGERLGLTLTPSVFSTPTPAPEGAPLQRDRPIILRVQAGGVFCCSEAGFLLGGGLGARPFNNERVEIGADLSFIRLGGHNGVYFSGNGYYHFKTSDPNFSPFAGAGLAIGHFFDDTQARFQIAGGLEFRSDGPNPIRPEIRFIFTEGDVTTVLLVSIGVGRR